jgi:hypothetical protein
MPTPKLPESPQARIEHCAHQFDRGYDVGMVVRIQLRNRGYSDEEIKQGALLADKWRSDRLLEYGVSGSPEYGRVAK